MPPSILLPLVEDVKSKPSNFTSSNEVAPENIAAIFVTFEVLKLLKFKLFKFFASTNIFPISVIFCVSHVSNPLISFAYRFPNNPFKFFVLLKFQSVTSIYSKLSEHNDDALHPIALVNVSGIFQFFIETRFKLLAPENIAPSILLPLVEDVKSNPSKFTSSNEVAL